MAATATRTATTTTTAQPKSFRAKPLLSRSVRGPSTSTSTPNLNAVYAAQSRRLHPNLPRKSSLAALTPRTLASIPDDSESYGLDTVLSETSDTMASTGQGRPVTEDAVVGDAVDVPGGMHGTVRFIGAVQGKKGTFVGIELHRDFAARGKNNGDVDG